MLLTMKQMQMLQPDGAGKLAAKPNLTEEERKELLSVDGSWLWAYEEHLITNYEELKK